MFVISNFMDALATLVNIILSACVWLVIGRVIISWVNADPYNPIVRFLFEITEPLLSRIRRFVPVFGGFDFSPIILILAIVFLQSFLVRTLHQLARSMG